MGDGGAYLFGFMLAWVAVMLPVRNSSVSAWAPLLVCAYPLLETGFSIWRRHNRNGHHPGQADSASTLITVLSHYSLCTSRCEGTTEKQSDQSIRLAFFNILCLGCNFFVFRYHNTGTQFYCLRCCIPSDLPASDTICLVLEASNPEA